MKLRKRHAELGTRRFARWVLLKRIGKPALRRLDRFMASQSSVGEAVIFENARFPWVTELEADWKTIRRELNGVLLRRETLPSMQQIQPDQYKVSPDDKWRIFVFSGFGYPSQRNRARCPETARHLDRIPGLTSAFFSLLAPGKHVPRHVGVTKGLLRCHLGLKIPKDTEKCVMELDGGRFHWEEGRAVVFDDTYKHEVRNDTDEERVVLLLDFVRPMRWPGRAAWRCAAGLLRLSPFVRSARRNQLAWEARTGSPGAPTVEALFR
jgi:aspartyl/asparaginyl beta-hydroxylase (cupin superfamily)